MTLIYSHESPEYRALRARMGAGRFNGAYYYSREITANISPRVETARPWVTVNTMGCAWDGSIIFVHNNLRPDMYEWLAPFKDLVLVCGLPETCAKVAHLGRAVHLPLSIDVGYVRQFARPKDRDAVYVGRYQKRALLSSIPAGTDAIEGVARDELLARMSRYRRVYAVGRCALEALALGCTLEPFDPRFPDTGIWQLLDNAEAAVMLQGMLDEIDGR